MACKISNGSSASLTQYAITSSGRFAHSSSIFEESISIFCLSSSSGNNRAETKDRVSRCGRNSMRACHHASTIARPARLHALFEALLGWSESRPRFISSSNTGQRPHPISSALPMWSLALRNVFARSTILGRSKLSIL